MSDLDSPSASEEPGKLERSNTSKSLKRQNTKAKDQVAEQTENFNTPGTIWYAVKKGDIETALRVIQENPSKLNERGPVGETPLHLCFLFNAPAQKEIARRLIEKYPDSIRYIYENPLYYGETVLHIAIVNKDFEMVRWLVQRDKGLLNICATGSFFQDGSPCYYGEYPLAFAVCTNNIPVVSYLLLSGADLFAQDTSGNNLLHMCVIHDLQRLYTYVVGEEKKILEAEEKEGKKVQRVPLSRMRNKADYTPLTLAAYLGKKDIFDFIFQQQRENQWTYGPVSCNIYPLEELDTLQDEEDDSKKHKSALEIIVNEKHLDLLMLPRIVDLLHMKWKHYAGRYFYKRCIQTTFFIVVLSLAVILRSPHFSYKNEWHDIFRAVCEIFVVLGWLYKGSKEMAELWGSGLQYFNQAGSAFLENNLSFLFLVFLPCAVICEAADSRARYFFVFWAIIFAWTYELTLLLGFKLTGPFVIMIYKMLTRDIARFASIYLLVLFGHTTAWYVIEEPTGEEVFFEYFFRLKADFLILMGQINFETFAYAMQAGYNWLSSLLLLFHVIFVFIMLLNVLIGMMSDTFNDIKDRSDQEWHLAYSQIIFSVESEIPSSVLKGANYWTLVNNKRFLQVQDVSKEYFQAIVEDESAPTSLLQEALKHLDTDKDGVISAEELKQAETKTIELKKQESVKNLDAEIEKPQNIGIVDGPLEGRLDPSTYTT